MIGLFRNGRRAFSWLTFSCEAQAWAWVRENGHMGTSVTVGKVRA